MTTHNLPLTFDTGHLFLETPGGQWLIDTGAPQTFGAAAIDLGDGEVRVATAMMGLDADQLSQLVGRPVIGLLGADLLNRSDWLFDVPAGRLARGSDASALCGTALGLDFVMGVPVLTATVAGQERRMFFDTGAQLSYLVDDSLDEQHSAARKQDFFPGVGPFETPVWRLPLALQGIEASFEFGRLPPLLEMTLALAGVEGILGNAPMLERRTAYLPTQRRIVFE